MWSSYCKRAILSCKHKGLATSCFTPLLCQVNDQILQLVNCRDIAGEYVLVQDPRMQCYSLEHVCLLCLGGVVLIIYTLGWFIFIACLMKVGKRKSMLKDPSFAHYQFLYSVYQPSYYW